MAVPHDYAERVYAGVLGKIIGVYLGRPFEGWSNQRIEAELGEINTFVHARMGKPLIVPDDDISGTFVFLRALSDAGVRRDLTAAAVGRAWLNYLVEGRTVLWWGGMGNSTEHTAYLRLKSGMQAPESGAMATNTQVVAEQIGAQIFVDGWAMVAPADPQLAVHLAGAAASVSHDGVAVQAAQVLAALEALAFTESDLDTLMDTALALIASGSLLHRLYGDVRAWANAHGPDWRSTLARIQQTYGYDAYGGNCHVVPNHALIVMALVHGEGDFRRSLSIVNTAGWDTDYNSGNLGCLLGIRNGLTGIDRDLREPVADRMLISSADAGGSVSDAVRIADYVVSLGLQLSRSATSSPGAGHGRDARFHFEYPGSVQGFSVEPGGQPASLENQAGISRTGQRVLAIRYHEVPAGGRVRVATATCFPLDGDLGGYAMHGSPTLHGGQQVRAAVLADSGNQGGVTVRLSATVVTSAGRQRLHGGDARILHGKSADLLFDLPDTGGSPVIDVAVELVGVAPGGTLYLDHLDWRGVPAAALGRPAEESGLGPWSRAWVNGVDALVSTPGQEDVRLLHNAGTGLLIRGSRDWRDYTFKATVRVHMARAGGIGVRVQGMRRYYALMIVGSEVQLQRCCHTVTVLASAPLPAAPGSPLLLRLSARGEHLEAVVNDTLRLQARDVTLDGGGVALLCNEGRVEITSPVIRPL